MIFDEQYKIMVLRGTTHACNLTGVHKGYDFGTQKLTFFWAQVADTEDLWEAMLSVRANTPGDRHCNRCMTSCSFPTWQCAIVIFSNS